MNQSNIPVITFNFKKEFEALTKALELKPAYEVEKFADTRSAATFVLSEQACLVIACVNSRDDLIQLAMLVKESKRKVDRVMKFVVFSQAGHQFDKSIAKLGIMDFLDQGLSIKALRFKVDFWAKSLKAQLKKFQTQENLKAKTKTEDGQQADRKVLDKAPVWLAPMDQPDDIWILKNEGDCKRIITKWLVKLMGPSPYVGRWMETNRNGLWEFKFKNEENDFCSKEGKWFFKGQQKPEFVWKENLWLLTGDNYDLYLESGEKAFSRVNCKSRVLSICKNSEYAKLKESLIVESFDSSLVCGTDEIEDGKERIENDGGQGLQNLKGKGKTDQLTDGPLSGKQKTTDKLNGDPLSGDGETDDFSSPLLAYGLKPGEQELSTGELALNLESSEEAQDEGSENTTEHLSTFYGLDKKRESEEARESAELKGKVKPEGPKPQGPYAGKTETDDVTAPLLALGLEEGDQELDHDELGLDGAPLKPGKAPEGEGGPADRLSSFYGKESKGGPEQDRGGKPLVQKKDPEKEGGAYGGKGETDHLKTHYESPAEGDDGEGERDGFRDPDEASGSPLRSKKSSKEGKISGDFKGEDPNQRPEVSLEVEEEGNVTSLTDRLRKKAPLTKKESNASVEEGKVASLDKHRSLKVFFDRAVEQYKRG